MAEFPIGRNFSNAAPVRRLCRHGMTWFFIAACGACGRKAILEPVDILARAGTGKVHRGINLSDLDGSLALSGLRVQKGASRSGRQNP